MKSSLVEIFLTALRLGLTSFGGPAAHIGYFRKEYVERKKWLTEESFAQTTALCQFLPGPASSQLGWAIGQSRGGWPGAVAAWLGFTLPSALFMGALAWVVMSYPSLAASSGSWAWVVHGLLLAAGAIVAQAVWSMAQGLIKSWKGAVLAVLGSAALLVWPSAGTQMAVLAVSGILGLWLFSRPRPMAQPNLPPQPRASFKLTWVLLTVFGVLLVGLPLVHGFFPGTWTFLADAFYRAGALVFGGGHVVLPLLKESLVPQVISPELFLAGYAATGLVPGPLFTFASYLGGLVGGAWGSALAVVSIFLPGLLLVSAALPFWSRIQNQPWAPALMSGLHAAVVGILGAALVNPVLFSAVKNPFDAGAVLALSCGLIFFKLPPWMIVLGGAAITAFFAAVVPI